MPRSEQGKQRYRPEHERGEFFCEHCAGSMGQMTGAVHAQLGRAHLHCIVGAQEQLPEFVRGALSLIPIQIPSRLGIWFSSLRLIKSVRRVLGRNKAVPDPGAASGGIVEALVCLSSATGKIKLLRDSEMFESERQQIESIRLDLVMAASALSWSMVNQVNMSRVLEILGSLERAGSDLDTIRTAASAVSSTLMHVRQSHRITCLDHTDRLCPMDQLSREVSTLLSRV